MSGIVLSASVRQNLLSLQSTADLLSTTQNRLATGKKVNSALDNPTNFFTAHRLDNRASDINNLLDGIGNGVQVLQAANTGITSLQKLVDTAKSIANQVLQTPVGYSTKANVDVTGTGAGTGTTTAADLNAGKLGGSVITFKTATGTLAVTIGSTFATGSGTATVKSLDQLNSVLAVQWRRGDRFDFFDGRHADLHLDQRRSQPDHHRSGHRSDRRGCRYPGHYGHRRNRQRCGRRCGFADHPRQPGQPVQRHPPADHHDCAGRFVQRHQPAERRQAQADVQRNRQVHPEHPGRDLQRDRSRPGFADRGHGLPGQHLGQHGALPSSARPAARCAPKRRRWVRTCRSCRSVRTSPRT